MDKVSDDTSPRAFSFLIDETTHTQSPSQQGKSTPTRMKQPKKTDELEVQIEGRPERIHTTLIDSNFRSYLGKPSTDRTESEESVGFVTCEDLDDYVSNL